MPNKRVIYSMESLWTGPSPATGAQASGNLIQLHRIQSVNYGFQTERTDVNQFGQLAAIDRIQLNLPTVNLDASYLVSNVRNESGIGLYVGGDVSALRYILDRTQDEKNYWVKTSPEGQGSVNYEGIDCGVIGIGNGTIASYSTEGSVGGLPTASFTVNGLNMTFETSSSGIQVPSINPNNGQPTAFSTSIPVAKSGVASQISTIRPGDITVDIAGAGFGLSNLCIQSYNLSFDLGLEPLICLGNKYPTSREIQFPITAQMSIEANIRDLASGTLTTLQCTDSPVEASVTLRAPVCDSSSLGAVKAKYTLKGAQLDSQSFSSSIGPGKSVSLQLSAQIGDNTDVNKGLFISGSII